MAPLVTTAPARGRVPDGPGEFPRAAILDHAHGRHLLLVGLGLLLYATFEFTQWQPREQGLSIPVNVLPVPAVAWYTAALAAFGGAFFALLRLRDTPIQPTNDLAIRRVAIGAVALAFGIEVAARIAGGGLSPLQRYIDVPTLAAAVLVAGGMLAVVLRWPPPTPALFGLMVGGGLALRVAWLGLDRSTPQHADNLAVIRLGLERLVSGSTPYAYFDFGTHTNPMPYLPWTFLSYLPAFVTGVDIRWTNIVLSLALVVGMWAAVRSLHVPSPTASGLTLSLAVFYLLPSAIGDDAQTEFQMFNLLLVATFALIALQRVRLAAVTYGMAAGAMTVAVFCAVPLLCYAVRTRPWREVAAVGALAFAGVLPVLVFLAWDAQAFLWAVSYVPRESSIALARGDNLLPYDPPFRLAWHSLGDWLRLGQVGVLATIAVLAWTRLRTIHGLIGLSVGSYLGLVLLGPYIVPHLFPVVLYLAVLAEAVTAAPGGSLQAPPTAARLT